MKFSTIAVAANAIATASAGTIDHEARNLLSPIRGYPFGNGFCLSDSQANFLAEQFKSVLTNPNRQAANTLATVLVASNYVETSDSINLLAGFPVSNAPMHIPSL